MWWQLDERLLETSTRLIVEHETYAKSVYDENRRRSRRSTGRPERLPLHRPETWDIDPGFNPYIVRSRRHRIGHAITERLRDRSYEPRPPAGFYVPKADGGERLISTFQIADEVISNRMLRSLTRKNLARLSARAYAYRPDVGPHDAISYITTELAREHRLFVAEYDFSRFFDTVDHDYLLEMLDKLGLTRTPLEHHVIEQFLKTPEPYVATSSGMIAGRARSQGIPQGTSLSLFLANIAAADLDRGLERLGVGFVRYADDTLIWSTDYGKVGAAASILHEASARIGSPINVKKSPGIRLLTKSETVHVEMAATKEVDYLGHRIGLRSVQMKPASVDRIKRRVGALIFNNLLLEPLAGTQEPSRLSSVDRDYVTLLWQLRRYLYGPLTEKEVRKFQRGAIPPMSFEGVMSFFPLVDDAEGLRHLDEWIASQIWLAMRKRARLLRAARLRTPAPHGVGRHQLIGFQTVSSRTGDSIDLRIPSVRKIASVIRLAVSTHGLRAVSGRAPVYLYGEEDLAK
ncbi:reverse transcriptase domain-containing protein [Microbacterium forte]|uniref:reverse transcriptase domain-containing protein n=1 Tax=Microbacterium forte TaxID=2982533 RepID=UPI0028937CC9|nr:reverse transcriptase domain-containing protein [Microbacterium sp. A(2022)]